MILGIDTGGTFTDFALLPSAKASVNSVQTHKVLSTPDAPERAILQGIQEMGLVETVRSGKLKIVHGTTVATNAALEGKGARTAFITNRGFKDLLSIGRQTRPRLYQLESPPQASPVPQELCLEIGGRIDAHGHELENIEAEDLQALVNSLETLKPDAIAINLLFSFLDSRHEEIIEDYLQDKLSWKPFICRSSFVLPEYKEYERGIATWLNASLGPLIKNYLLALKTNISPAPLAIMQSSGGTVDASQAANMAVNLLLSGPAGGLAAASFLAKRLKQPQLMTFDMGGTSSDVALISDEEIKLTNEGKIGAYPASVPMVDMHTIGAGGGSIAFIDDGGLLQVGPASAGANPGPACYGLGGTSATVTDANFVLGRLLPEAFMGGKLSLDKKLSASVIKELSDKLALTSEKIASGIIRIVNEHMARALRVISVERGFDPKAFRLCCFGGAGGLHICALAEALGMNKALVPIHAGVLSAIGMFLAPIERQLSISHQKLISDIEIKKFDQIVKGLSKQAINQIEEELTQTINGKPPNINIEVSADLRYFGQSAYLNLPWQGQQQTAQAFHLLHASRYGHQLKAEIELVNIRVAAKAQAERHELSPMKNRTPCKPIKMTPLHGFKDLVPVYERKSLSPGQEIQGPALIFASNSSTFIEENWQVLVDEFGNLFLNTIAKK